MVLLKIAEKATKQVIETLQVHDDATIDNVIKWVDIAMMGHQNNPNLYACFEYCGSHYVISK